SVHGNSFMIQRSIFEQLGGYDERFCGRYGGDDIDFNSRYEQLCKAGRAKPAEIIGDGYYYPDPEFLKEQFHLLRRQVAPAPQKRPEQLPTPSWVCPRPSPSAIWRNHTIRLRDREAKVRFATRGAVDLAILEQIWGKDAYGVRATARVPA